MSLRVPVCVKCRRTMKCAKNEYPVKVKGGGNYSGDKYACEGCGVEVVVGFGADLSHNETVIFETFLEITDA